MKSNSMKKLILVISACITLGGTVSAIMLPAERNTKNVSVTAANVENEMTPYNNIEKAPENETEQQSESTETQIVEATEPQTQISENQEPQHVTTDLSATKYAKQSSNVRSGPTTDYEIIGSLSTNDEIAVTGQADTGWYRISYNGGEGYVSDSLLADTPVEIKQSASASGETNGSSNQTCTSATGITLDLSSEDALVRSIVSQVVTPDMDPYTIATTLNNYLCATMSYDDSCSHVSTWDALAYGTGVCQGYANAYCRLMNAAGIPTDYVRGQGWTGSSWGRHGWNRSLINGSYYYTDVTWNDTLGNVYLLVSYDEISRTHYEEEINPSNRIK